MSIYTEIYCNAENVFFQVNSGSFCKKNSCFSGEIPGIQFSLQPVLQMIEIIVIMLEKHFSECYITVNE